MKRSEKQEVINLLKEKINNHASFYIADTAALDVATVNALRRLCHSQGVEFMVTKNTFLKLAMESCEADYSGLYDSLKGPTAIFFSDVANKPAKLFKEFRKKSDKPVLKAAYIDTDVYTGDDQIEVLASLKSKEELIGDIIALLQSPAKNVISALKGSASDKIAGLVKTLEERSE